MWIHVLELIICPDHNCIKTPPPPPPPQKKKKEEKKKYQMFSVPKKLIVPGKIKSIRTSKP